MSLRLRMVLGVAALVLLVAAGSAALCTHVAEVAMTAQFSHTMRSLTENLARNAAHGVFIESGETLRELADHLMDEPDINMVAVLNADDELILRAGPKDEDVSAGPYSLVPAPVYFDAQASAPIGPVPVEALGGGPPKIIGRVEVTYSKARLEQDLTVVRWRVWLVAVFAGMVGILAAVWLSGRMVRPLHAMTRATEAIAEGDLNVRVAAPEGGDELARLAANFNHMAVSLMENQEELKRTYAALSRKERLATLGEFTAVIAHELRNPLGILLSSAQVIAKPDRPPEMKEKAANFIVDEVRRLNADLTAFLNFARPKPADPRPMPPAKVLARAADSFRARTLRATGEAPTGGDNVSIDVHVEDDIPEVMADPDQLHQALLNLLFNASQALGEEGGHIALSAAADGATVELYIDDNGPGIPAEARARLFEPFFTTKKKGTGLGLAVVAQIAESHGGEILAGTAPLGGARFTIRLPQAPATDRSGTQS